MPIELHSEQEAKVLAQALKDGVVPVDRQQEAMGALKSYHTGTKTFVAPGISKDSFVESVKGTADVIATVASSGFAEATSGVVSAIALLYGGTLDQAVDAKEDVSKKLTHAPSTKGGKKVLEDVAPILMKVEDGVDRFSERAAMGNPAAATLIKTTLLGGLEILPAGKGVKAGVKYGKKVRDRRKVVQKVADKHGINLDIKTFGDDIVAAVKKMTPEERAQNLPLVRRALTEAKTRESARKAAMFDEARSKRTFIETRAVRDLSDNIEAQLTESGFDLGGDNMGAVRRTLDDMKSSDLGFADGKHSAVRFNQLELVRRRINKRHGADRQTNAALNSVKKGIDDFIDNEFNNIAIEAGRIPRGKGAISGDAAGVKAWKDARAANVRWHKRFNADKAISQLIEKESTPEQYRQWLMGASAMHARKEAALTIRRMKDVLGKDHQAINGIRQDFVFELVEPLLSDQPNFRGFVNKFDKMVRNNPQLVKELDLSTSALKDLRDFARVQQDLPVGGALFTPAEIAQLIARFSVGHGIAKAGARVSITGKLLKAMTGIDVVSKKQIMADIANVKFGEVAIPSKGPLAAQFIAGAALTGIEEPE